MWPVAVNGIIFSANYANSANSSTFKQLLPPRLIQCNGSQYFVLTANRQTGQECCFAYDFEHPGAQHAVRERIQGPEMLHLHSFAVSSANCWISANYAKSSYLSNSTSHIVPVHKKAEHAIYSSRPEYFNSTDNSISTD